MIDTVARRYGCLPSEVLDADAENLAILALVIEPSESDLPREISDDGEQGPD